MNWFETIENLTRSPGPSGFESAAARSAAALLAPLVDEVRFDKLGSVIGVKHCGKEGAKRLLLDAHLDEVGMVVTGYDGRFLRFAQLGGIDPRVLVNREVQLLTQSPIWGLICAQLPEEGDKAPALGDLRIDTGLSAEEVRSCIPIGTPVSYAQPLFKLGEKSLAGKSLDDRCCFALLLRTMELLQEKALDVDVFVLGSVGEETDSRGAIAAAYSVNPDCAVAVDVTFGKSPDSSGSDSFPLGGGPVLGVGPNVAHWMLRRFKEKAQEERIPTQIEVMAGSTGTNGWDIQIQRSGIATAILSVPLRYMHTPIEVIHQEDLEHCARLLAAFAQGLGEEEALCGNY